MHLGRSFVGRSRVVTIKNGRLKAYELEWSRFDVSKLLVRSLPLLVDVYNVHVIRNRSEQVANVMARLFPKRIYHYMCGVDNSGD